MLSYLSGVQIVLLTPWQLVLEPSFGEKGSSAKVVVQYNNNISTVTARLMDTFGKDYWLGKACTQVTKGEPWMNVVHECILALKDNVYKGDDLGGTLIDLVKRLISDIVALQDNVVSIKWLLAIQHVALRNKTMRRWRSPSLRHSRVPIVQRTWRIPIETWRTTLMLWRSQTSKRSWSAPCAWRTTWSYGGEHVSKMHLVEINHGLIHGMLKQELEEQHVKQHGMGYSWCTQKVEIG